MKVTAKAPATSQDIATAVRIANRVKALPASSPLLPGLTRRYAALVDRLGYDPIS
ncbi:hypothetical protein AB0N38_11715 [Micromonospora aurantiaca]|uniref:hypothetical protein n=1 Tax=Micromonospora aurantiaca (nom. illeg.) TaxID=47850 RepID=UPI00341C8904